MKKAFSVFLAMALLTVLVAGVALGVSAMEPPDTYEFDTWTGSGDASVHVKGHYTKFDKITTDGQEVDPSNYTITGKDSGTIITLKEEYLKTLSNGEYSFEVRFFEEIEWLEYEFNIDMQTGEAIVPREDEKIFRIFCDNEEVDPSNYTITADNKTFVIIFEKEYLQTLTGEEVFCASIGSTGFTDYLNLIVDMQPTTTTTTVVTTTTTGIITTIVTTTTSPILSDETPKTGDSESMITLFVIMSLSAVGCAVALVSRRRENNIA